MFFLIFNTDAGAHPASHKIDINIFPIGQVEVGDFDPSSPTHEVPLHAVVAWSATALLFALLQIR